MGTIIATILDVNIRTNIATILDHYHLHANNSICN